MASEGNLLPIPRSSRGNADVSRNELRRGRHTCGPYENSSIRRPDTMCRRPTQNSTSRLIATTP